MSLIYRWNILRLLVRPNSRARYLYALRTVIKVAKSSLSVSICSLLNTAIIFEPSKVLVISNFTNDLFKQRLQISILFGNGVEVLIVNAEP